MHNSNPYCISCFEGDVRQSSLDRMKVRHVCTPFIGNIFPVCQRRVIAFAVLVYLFPERRQIVDAPATDAEFKPSEYAFRPIGDH